MSTLIQKFKNLHEAETPFLLGNVWDVKSAQVYEKLGFEAIGTSSAAIAHNLGYEDGENIPFKTYLFIVERITANVKLPLSVDIETGYGKDIETVVANIVALSKLGVAGINIEDTVVNDHHRTFKNAAIFRDKLIAITTKLKEKGITMFINVRSDAYLLDIPDAIAEAKKRIDLYEPTGIDGIFLPCLNNEEEIKAIAAYTTLPLNVMCVPGLPHFDILKKTGIKRISMGNFINDNLYKHMESKTSEIVSGQSFASIF